MSLSLMIQGTGSDVGKSLIVAGLSRALVRRGMSVRPFKPQNMSNNAAVTVEGGEIGRAQALQARACEVSPSVHMNPLLLKPETDKGAQVILRGARVATLDARRFMAERGRYLEPILESFEHLRGEADIVLVEGAGSPAEINLRDGDIANMGFALAADVPVVLAADIHRGGVIAAIVGTLDVITPDDAARIGSFLVNNFRGDVSLFDDGVRFLEARTGRPCGGVIPHFADASRLPAEDAVALESLAHASDGQIKVAVPRLARIANFDDLDPLRHEPDIDVQFINPGEPLPGDADLVLLPGSKSTIGDLNFLRAQGWDIDIAAHVRRGGRVLGICGGYQMLGRLLHDPKGLEGSPGSADGLGFLDVETTLDAEKRLEIVSAVHVATGRPISGYEMHLGRSEGADTARPFLTIDGRTEGAVSADGRIAGTYLHGIFAQDGFRRAFIEDLGARHHAALGYDASIDQTLDRLAEHLETHVNIDLLLDIAARSPAKPARATERTAP
jgi:adenosylcobyric acid synthase